jgi:hypothetical protein
MFWRSERISAVQERRYGGSADGMGANSGSGLCVLPSPLCVLG